MSRLSQGLLDVGCCCGISATLRGGVTFVTFMQAKSVVRHKKPGPLSKLLPSKILSDTVLHFPFPQFHTVCLVDFFVAPSSKACG